MYKCNLCPKMCNIDRDEKVGFCCVKNEIKIARASLHFYEEPSISGINGSGAIFFSGCNLKCVFCQNMNISNNAYGKYISVDRLSEIMLELQEKNAHNINLVTPTMFIPLIKESIIKAKKMGLNIPIVYNSSGYESVDSLKTLSGLIDVYLPDFKYYSNDLGLKYSKVSNYSDYAKEALNEMYRQVGKCKFTKNGLIKSGMIVRHLMIPKETNDTKCVLKYLHDTYGDNIYISIMNQYTPPKGMMDNLALTIDDETYNNIIDYALSIGINNAYCQLDGTVSESFIPEFDLTGVEKKD